MVDGEWQQRKLSKTEINSEQWQSIRNKRDQLLAESDWTQMPDSTLYQDQAWLDYRTALRNLPQSFDNPDDVVWPEKPN